MLPIITAASGTVNAVDGPARQVYVLDLVGVERLAGAVSLYEVILNLSRVLGPALGGVLLALSGPAACVLVNAITFAAPLTVLLRFRPDGCVSRTRPAQAARERWMGSATPGRDRCCAPPAARGRIRDPVQPDGAVPAAGHARVPPRWRRLRPALGAVRDRRAPGSAAGRAPTAAGLARPRAGRAHRVVHGDRGDGARPAGPVRRHGRNRGLLDLDDRRRQHARAAAHRAGAARPCDGRLDVALPGTSR